jgi:flagella synthesis protein FlgN
MIRNHAIRRLFEGMRQDAVDYASLQDVLEAQFVAAIKHRAEEVRTLCDRILNLTSSIEARRQERVSLAKALLGAGNKRVSVRAVAARLPESSRSVFDARCNGLEKLVAECKRLNARNSHLMMTQREIMQRVLGTERDTYGPA